MWRLKWPRATRRTLVVPGHTKPAPARQATRLAPATANRQERRPAFTGFNGPGRLAS
jgi:hypothetical protein